MLWLTSRLFDAHGVRHGFTLRADTEPPFQNLNLGSFFETDAAPWRAVAQAAGARPEDFALAKQVHGDRIVDAARWTARDRPQADGVVSRTAGLAAAVRVADCVPLLLYAPDVGAAAAVHSGWRGARLSIAARGVEALQRLGASPERMLAAIGPCIHRCCYEVSAELARDFADAFGPGVAAVGASPRLDLTAAVSIALRRAGVTADHIDVLDACTSCDRGFFSYRRDHGQTGRQMGFVFPER